MDRSVLSSIVFFSIAVQVFATNNSYVILAPKNLRSGMTVNLNVLVLKEDPPGTPVDIEVTFLLDSVPITSAAGQFRAGVLASLKLSIPFTGFKGSEKSYYRRKQLRVVGSGGLSFNTTSDYGLSFSKKGFSIYIQTDKGIYKPGQTVRMRILAVYPSLKVHRGKMTIDITDPKNNKLALWKDEVSDSGVIARDFELTSQPNLGVWKITVMVDGGAEIKTFEVNEYVLPKFKVDVLTNSYAPLGNGEIRGRVSAKYTYGKGVKGFGKIWIQFPRFSRSRKCDNEYPAKEFKINGDYSFVIPEEEINEIYFRHTKNKNAYSWVKQATVNVSVTEDLTGKTYFGSTKVTLRPHDVALTFPAANPNLFKPDVKFQILLRATRPDDIPLFNQTIRIQVFERFASFRSVDGNRKWTSYATDQNGYVSFNLQFSNSVLGVSILAETTAKNGKTVRISKYLQKFVSPTGTFLLLTADSYLVQAGENIVINATATSPFSALNYVVLSRGNIVRSNSVSFASQVTSAIVNIPSEREMSPSANIVVYFIKNDSSEIIAESLRITVEGPFENKVSVKFSRAQTKPGENVAVTVKSSPFSQVGLLAVDKSVLLLDKGNDISVTQVMRELGTYGGFYGNFFPTFLRRRQTRSARYFIPWYPSGTNAKQLFENAGIHVLTDVVNFVVRRRPFLWFRRRPSFRRRLSFRRRNPSVTFSRNSPNLAEVKKVRSFFPETWLWEDIKTNSTGYGEVRSTSPDTITSWVLSAFAVSNVTGFGVGDDKPELRVFQPFFLSLDLPYSVIRGEQVAVKVIVFNYENEDMEVFVTLRASSDWKVINRSNPSDAENDHSGDVVSIIRVPANSGATVSFPIIPLKLGNVPVVVSAQSTSSADAVRKNLLVEPEGIEQDYSYSLLLDMNTTSEFRQQLELSLPANVVNGSAKAVLSVIGDILGSSISGIENLLRMPYGCGEQNMVNFAPSMFIRSYLETVGQLTASLKEKSQRFMTLGYQRELKYQHRDGSYSAFGDKYGKPRPGSLWLTAFVVRSFSRAQSYIYIDPTSLSKSVKFILSYQQKDGTFKEPGSVSSYLQGGLKSTNQAALTAYVTTSLLEYNSKQENVQTAISRALKFLESQLEKFGDPYTLALIAYTFELANHRSKEIVLTKLLAKAIRKDGMMYWREKRDKTKLEQDWLRPYYRPRSADVEITSYALLVYAHRQDRQNGLPIARWLAQQRNSLGGYASTQDTVVGLQALSKFAPLVFTDNINFRVTVQGSGDESFSKSFLVDKTNMIVLQRFELPSIEGDLLITGRGEGIGMLQVGVTYNVDKPPADESFNLAVQVITADSNKVEALSCVTYTGDGSNSGMAILEFGLPSGFSLDHEEVAKLSENSLIKKVETPGRKSILYFDTVSKSEKLCLNITSVRSHAVGKPQPIPVVVYDYYKPEKRAVVLYSVGLGVDLCAVCSDCVDCGDVAKKAPRTDNPGPARDGSSSIQEFSVVFILFVELYVLSFL